ncbi:mitochondrial carrier [Myriangium duriaei CBS 260.36]|uniref:Mitochondrial carrier n=1 Tax=Myriangium duriaei CBS 260.36 TaxID=1168546 RepID=A0A9P4J627_9PEZI|nr:mitochondrial carrier [Myriangium duriaei CBS 260.36]
MSGNTNRDILIAGAFAAFTVDLLVYPLDTLKTRIQSPDYARLYTNAATNTVNKPALFRGLYQGLGSVILATLPSSGAFFTTYEATKSLTAPLPLPTPILHSFSSSLAELVSCAILTPAEVIKQNAQMVSSPSSTSATMQTLNRFRSNPLALWRGYTALAGRNLPFTALQFPLFERLKRVIRERRGYSEGQTPPVLEASLITAAAAGSAGSVAAVITTPVDVVKTRIMLAAAESAGDDPAKTKKRKAGKPDAKSTLDALGQSVSKAKETLSKPVSRKSSLQIAREIVAERGVVGGLFRGGALRAVWTLLGSGLYLGVYEGGRQWLGAGSREGEDDA